MPLDLVSVVCVVFVAKGAVALVGLSCSSG